MLIRALHGLGSLIYFQPFTWSCLLLHNGLLLTVAMIVSERSVVTQSCTMVLVHTPRSMSSSCHHTGIALCIIKQFSAES